MQHPEGAGLEGLKDQQQYPWEMNAELPKCRNQAQWIWVLMLLEEQHRWGVGKQKLPSSIINPADRRVLQAFPNMPDFAKEIADSISLCGTSAGVELFEWLFLPQGSTGFHIHFLSILCTRHQYMCA